MADTRAAAGLTVQQWDDQFFVEYIQGNRFASDMGKTENSIIQVKEGLGDKRGESITFGLLNRLVGSGVTGNQKLRGNEEALVTRSHKLDIIVRRNAFVVSMQEEQYSAIDLRNAGRAALKMWAEENTRDRIIQAMGSVNGVNYTDATEAEKDAWLVDNQDRVLFGASKSNHSALDHSAALANIDNTNDKLTSAAASLMKRIALTASPKIRPYMSETSGRRYFCAYVSPLTFRDLKNDATITAAQRDVSLRMQNEKLFMGGDIEWDGIIFKEVDEIPVYPGVGAGGIQVSPVFFCGAQAIGYGVNRRWFTAEDPSTDYGMEKGLAITAFDNFDKLRFGTGSGDTTDRKDHGMVTGWFAAVADA